MTTEINVFNTDCKEQLRSFYIVPHCFGQNLSLYINHGEIAIKWQILTNIPFSIEDNNKEMHISWAVNQEITYVFNSHRSPRGIQELGHGSRGKRTNSSCYFVILSGMGKQR